MKKIFIIDDDELILESFSMIFTDLGYEVITSSQGERGVEIALAEDFDLVLTDVRMPGLNGSEVVSRIRRAKPQARVLVITAYPGDPMVQKAMEAGALGIMKKPFEVAKIIEYLKD